ncbi:unnamed protein product [Miscanthus lutarioriparius]|uniref:Uncharacterized protein n=1 Tax=Miscanthus lutarioriparius TaxID=422564 RepID=A0A811RDW8_9POAL|nr:unnamed protein product [Miscanthus lutarioriparius]
MQPPVTPPVATGAATPAPPRAIYSQPSSSPLAIASTKTGRRQLLVSSALLLAASSSASTAAGAQAAGEEGGLAGYSGPPPVVTEAERAASAAVSRRVGEAVGLLELGRELQARGEFPEALASFTRVVREYADLALSEYARVGRALIHAALAAALYADKHAALLAENQFAIATLLDPHYTDLAYVRETKHWPPSLVASLHDFITLS